MIEDMEREGTQTIRFDALDGSVVKLPDGRNVLLSFTGEVGVEGGDSTVSYTYRGFCGSFKAEEDNGNDEGNTEL